MVYYILTFNIVLVQFSILKFTDDVVAHRLTGAQQYDGTADEIVLFVHIINKLQLYGF